MPERTTVTESTQIGVESTPGTGVAANKKLNSLGITLEPEFEAAVFTPSGNKFPTVAAPGKEWVGGALTGNADYQEITYALAGIFGAPVITTPGGGTTSRYHTYTVSPSALQDPKTYTVERGSSVRAEKAAYCAFPAVALNYTRDAIEVSGEVIGQRLQDGITMTGSPTSLALQPILPSQVVVKVDPTFGAIGTTKLLRVLEANAGWSSRFGALWPLDSAVTSFLSLYEVMPGSDVRLVQVADAAAMAQLTNARAGTVAYLEIDAQGAVIEAAIPYELRVRIPVKVVDFAYGDQDGLKTVEWTYQSFADTTATYAAEFRVTNTLTAL